MTADYISNFSIQTSKTTFGKKHRAEITTIDNQDLSIAIKKHTPNIFTRMYWKKVHYETEGKTEHFYVNRGSLANRLKVPPSLVKASLKNKENKNFDQMLLSLNKFHKLSFVIKIDEDIQNPDHQSAKIIKKIENNRKKYISKAEQSGSFVEKWPHGRYLVVYHNPLTENTEFYLALSKNLGEGSSKTVQPLVNYQTGKANLALGIQREGKNLQSLAKPARSKEAMKDITSKNILKTQFIIENGLTRLEDGTIKSNGNAKVFIASKRCIGTFEDIQNNFPLDTKLRAFIEVLEGVQSMHEAGIIHRDLKQDNILYRNAEPPFKIRLIDFDDSHAVDNLKALKKIRGTPSFIPPEVLRREEIQYPEAIDCWSLGVILYELCEKKEVIDDDYYDKSDKKQADVLSLLAENFNFKNIASTSTAAIVITSLLDPNPATRMSVDQALMLLKQDLK